LKENSEKRRSNSQKEKIMMQRLQEYQVPLLSKCKEKVTKTEKLKKPALIYSIWEKPRRTMNS